ncbi:centrosomal protein of 78 kDa [Macrosteles quadrilineatus]|uniref:centrosomal protein of 78 kDa n=1 Tax=Macrosteles quadrilineatus TaxID=74068 RepID=UPI0023E32FC3|nr:centrosomal protein of 78 kDa [Macrosteles quadrilineatus]
MVLLKSAMSPSTTDQKKNVHNFMESYPSLCRFFNITPYSKIELNTSNKFLDFVGDRLKPEEWKPLLEAISNDRCLHFISVRSKYNKSKVSQMNLRKSQSQSTITSCANITDEVVLKLTEALSNCLTHSSALTGLLLEKLTLGADSLNRLNKGLEVCRNLQQLSLPYCQIGDEGCASLCYVFRHRLNLIWLNLSGCSITEKGVGILCDLLKYQKLSRYGESWKQSLRYRPVNPNSMPGLRRLTLNHNPFGDAGVKIIVDTLIDDLWLKALDLQDCNVSLVGGELVLNLVKENQFLSVLDLRGNTKIPKSMVGAVVQQLAENNADATLEFQWLKEDNMRTGSASSIRTSISKSSMRPSVVSNTTFCSKAKPRIPIMTIPPSTQWQRRARSVSSARPAGFNNQPVVGIHYKKSNESILSELNFVKNQLQEFKKRLEEETQKRKQLEEQLENYKRVTVPSNNSSEDIPKRDNSSVQLRNNNELEAVKSVPEKNIVTAECDKSKEDIDSVDFLIETMNENLRFRSKSNISLYRPDDTFHDQNEATTPVVLKSEEAPSKAQLLFEKLISS